eukprot:Partr_v1_DN27472_c2_g1_i3_m71918 putative NA
MDKQLERLLNRQVVSGQSFSDFRLMLQELSYDMHCEKMYAYYAHAVSARKKNWSAISEKMIVPFPKNVSGLPSRAKLTKLYKSHASSRIEYESRCMMALKGDILSGDHTFKIAKMPVVGKKAVFKATYHLMNESNQVIAHWMCHTSSISELRPDLQLVRERYGQECGPKVFYTDICCSERSLLTSIFPSLEAPPNSPQRVLLDAFHFMKRYSLPKKHPLHSSFVAALRKAIFIDSNEDRENVRAIALDRGATEDHVDTQLSHRYLRASRLVRRPIPEASILASSISEVFNAFAEISSTLITPVVVKEHSNQMKHVVKGCLSDHPEIDLNFRMPFSEDSQFTRYKTARESSALEHLHDHEFQCVKAKQCGLELADALLSNILFRWNLRAGIRAGIYSDQHTPNLGILEDICNLAAENSRWVDFAPLESFAPLPRESNKPVEKFGCRREVELSVDSEDELDNGETESWIPEPFVDPALTGLGLLIERRLTGSVPLIQNENPPFLDDALSDARIEKPIDTAHEIELLVDILGEWNGPISMRSYGELAARWNARVRRNVDIHGQCYLKQVSFKTTRHIHDFIKKLSEFLASEDILGNRPETRQRLQNMTDLINNTDVQPKPAAVFDPLPICGKSLICQKCGSVFETDAFNGHIAAEVCVVPKSVLQSPLETLLENPDIHVCSLCEGVLSQRDPSTKKFVYQNGHDGKICPVHNRGPTPAERNRWKAKKTSFRKRREAATGKKIPGLSKILTTQSDMKRHLAHPKRAKKDDVDIGPKLSTPTPSDPNGDGDILITYEKLQDTSSDGEMIVGRTVVLPEGPNLVSTVNRRTLSLENRDVILGTRLMGWLNDTIMAKAFSLIHGGADETWAEASYSHWFPALLTPSRRAKRIVQHVHANGNHWFLALLTPSPGPLDAHIKIFDSLNGKRLNRVSAARLAEQIGVETEVLRINFVGISRQVDSATCGVH